MIDSSIYNKSTMPDMVGSVTQGFKLGNLIKQSLNDHNKANENKLYGQAFTDYTNGKGDKSNNLARIAHFNPEMAYKLKQQELSEARIDQRNKSQLAEKRYNRAHKDKMFKLKEDELKAKELESVAKGKQAKADQFKVGGFAKRAIMAEKVLSDLPADVGTSGFSDTVQGSSIFPEAWKSDQRKEFEQSQRNFISAVLRRESGAAISDTEMENESIKYFPQPGDGEKVLAQKKMTREQAINNLKSESGNALSLIADAKSNFKGKKKKQGGGGIIKSAYANNSAWEHPKAKAATEWAKKNKDNPKAKEILRRLGVE